MTPLFNRDELAAALLLADQRQLVLRGRFGEDIIDPAFGGEADGPARFVFVIMRGALDGLAVVPPWGDVDYAALRGEVGLVFQIPELQLYAPSAREDVAFGPRRLRWAEARVRPPALFLCGAEDPVLKLLPRNALELQRSRFDDLRGEVLVAGAGHFVQQERPEETNAALLRFLDEVRRAR